MSWQNSVLWQEFLYAVEAHLIAGPGLLGAAGEFFVRLQDLATDWVLGDPAAYQAEAASYGVPAEVWELYEKARRLSLVYAN